MNRRRFRTGNTLIHRFLRPTALAAALSLAACSAAQTTGQSVLPVASSNASSTARHIQDSYGNPRMDMSVALYDAPLPKQGDVHVYLAIAGLDVVDGLTVTPLAAFTSPQIVDLLTLQHSAFVIGGSLPAGAYDGLRLLVDTAGSRVVVNGRVYPMVFTRRLHQSQPAVVALDALAPVAGSAGSSVAVDVDFNVLESISLRNGVAYVQPKIVAAKQAARVTGRVVNAQGNAVEDATIVAYDAAGNVANTSLTGEDGKFTMHALKAGTYTVKVLNTYVTASGDTVTAEGVTAATGPVVPIAVAPGDTLDIGTLGD